MKKKFVLILALVLMVAVSLTAAPLELAGEFKASREFTFNPTAVTPASSLKFNKLSLAGDFWKITVTGDLSFDTAVPNRAVADIYLDKALAEQGVDMGDVSLTLSVGNLDNSAILNVYDDPNDSLGSLEMDGVTSGTTALTVGYADMVTVKAALSFDATNKPFVISAQATPVDGVEATVGFTNYAVGDTKGGLGGSVKIDVAALAGLDFDLYASVYDKYLLDTAANSLYATVGGGFADVAVDGEFVMAATNDLKFNASYSGIENLGLSAGLELIDLSDIKTTISGAVDYTLGGVKYKVAADYAVATEAFTLTPSVSIKF